MLPRPTMIAESIPPDNANPILTSLALHLFTAIDILDPSSSETTSIARPVSLRLGMHQYGEIFRSLFSKSYLKYLAGEQLLRKNRIFARNMLKGKIMPQTLLVNLAVKVRQFPKRFQFRGKNETVSKNP